MFDRATLKLSGGRTLVVTRRGKGIYVSGVELHGAPYASEWLAVARLRKGENHLAFVMQETPDTERGTAAADRPPSFR